MGGGYVGGGDGDGWRLWGGSDDGGGWSDDGGRVVMMGGWGSVVI